LNARHECVVVGAGPAGLATSAALNERGVDHVVLERHEIGHSWRTQRWDSFRLNTPGWCNLMLGDVERDDYSTGPEVVARLDGLAEDLPVQQNTPVESLDGAGTEYVLRTPSGELRTPAVVLATGDQNVPRVPAIAQHLPEWVQQLHAAEYRNADQLPDGAVLVVGSAQSGCQIAEDLVAAGRKVYLATSRVSRFRWHYRGRDTMEWLTDVGFFDQRPQDLEDAAMVHAAQPIVASGGRSLSLQLLGRSGVTLLGRIVSVDGRTITFDDSAVANVRFGNEFADRVCTMIDTLIERTGVDAPPAEPDESGGPVAVEVGTALDFQAAGVTSIVWCTGFTGDFSWVHRPVLNDVGLPHHDGGASNEPGLWFVGLKWLSSRKSGILFGFPDDAAAIADQVTARLATA
jgi:putative flavoprotein involved in K+ transport